MANNTSRPISDREEAFIARANEIKRFIQTVGMFAICIASALTAAVMNLPGPMAMLTGASAIVGPLSFLWFIERLNLYPSPERTPRALRNFTAVIVFMIAIVAGAVSVTLVYGARVGLAACLLAYGAEFAVAVASRYRGLLKASQA